MDVGRAAQAAKEDASDSAATAAGVITGAARISSERRAGSALAAPGATVVTGVTARTSPGHELSGLAIAAAVGSPTTTAVHGEDRTGGQADGRGFDEDGATRAAAATRIVAAELTPAATSVDPSADDNRTGSQQLDRAAPAASHAARRTGSTTAPRPTDQLGQRVDRARRRRTLRWARAATAARSAVSSAGSA